MGVRIEGCPQANFVGINRKDSKLAPTYSLLQRLSTQWILYFASLIKLSQRVLLECPTLQKPLTGTEQSGRLFCRYVRAWLSSE
jgi:hypothetical protein